MNTNIDISLLNNYFTNKPKKKEKKEKTQTKIVPYSIFSKKEKNVINIIKKIH